MVRVVVPAILDVPQPRLAPEDPHAVDEDRSVVDKPVTLTSIILDYFYVKGIHLVPKTVLLCNW